jgi:hypothetical protein
MVCENRTYLKRLFYKADSKNIVVGRRPGTEYQARGQKAEFRKQNNI